MVIVFLAKGYSREELQEQMQQVAVLDRAPLIQDNIKNNQNKDLSGAIIHDYNKQNKKVESIICKHWPILLKDREMQKVLPSRPQFIYHMAANLRDRLVKSVLDPLGLASPLFWIIKASVAVEHV